MAQFALRWKIALLSDPSTTESERCARANGICSNSSPDSYSSARLSLTRGSHERATCVETGSAGHADSAKSGGRRRQVVDFLRRADRLHRAWHVCHLSPRRGTNPPRGFHAARLHPFRHLRTDSFVVSQDLGQPALCRNPLGWLQRSRV